MSDLNRNALCDDPLRCMKLLSTVSPISVNLQALLLKAFTKCDQAVHFGQLFGVKKNSLDEKIMFPNEMIMQGQKDL